VVCAFIVALLAALMLTQKPADAQQIKVHCEVYATNYVDPIAFADHLHHQIGNTSTTNTSTGQSLFNNRSTSCNEGWLTSAGWFPVERNEVHGNGDLEQRYGIGARDAANALIQNNRFGAVTIAGVAYPRNNLGAIRASDSGRSDRPNLTNIDIVNNTLNGEAIKGCELPDSVVFCANNSR
jgi:hypothetical protein